MMTQSRNYGLPSRSIQILPMPTGIWVKRFTSKGDSIGAIASTKKPHRSITIRKFKPCLPGLRRDGQEGAGSGDFAKAKRDRAAAIRSWLPFRFDFTIGLGDKTTAIQYLERCSQDRENIDLDWIKVDPLLDPLRGDPRFDALVQKLFAKQ